ncbi:MAG: Spy/CpxP family protein refolding chaperone [Janthinobacterium lividum]
MSNFKKTIVVGATVVMMGAVSFGAYAQRTPSDAPAAAAAASGSANAAGAPRGPEGRSRPDPARMEQAMARRAARMHDELKISAAQESAWNSFVSSMKPAQPPGPRPDRAAWKSMTAPQRMEQELAHLKNTEAGMTARLAATRALYAVLTPEQQKTFDEKTAHRHHGGRRDHGPHDGRPGGPGHDAPGAPPAPPAAQK